MLLYPPDHVFEDEDASADAASASRSWLGGSTSPKAERVRRQLVLMLTRRFKIQALVAEAYLAVADWDPLRAIDQYREFPSAAPRRETLCGVARAGRVLAGARTAVILAAPSSLSVCVQRSL